jgi:hypothetical protein
MADSRKRRKGIMRYMALFIALICLIMAFIFVAGIHGFLAISMPVKADILVVESWVSEKALSDIKNLPLGAYKQVIIVGPSEVGERGRPSGLSTRALLVRNGVIDSVIREITVIETHGNHTLSFAQAVRQYFLAHGSSSIAGCNIFSEGVHARKSFIIYKKNLRQLCLVGIISGTPGEYDPKTWLLSPVGIAWVVLDTVKTLRACLLGY